MTIAVDWDVKNQTKQTKQLNTLTYNQNDRVAFFFVI